MRFAVNYGPIKRRWDGGPEPYHLQNLSVKYNGNFVINLSDLGVKKNGQLVVSGATIKEFKPETTYYSSFHTGEGFLPSAFFGPKGCFTKALALCETPRIVVSKMGNGIIRVAVSSPAFPMRDLEGVVLDVTCQVDVDSNRGYVVTDYSEKEVMRRGSDQRSTEDRYVIDSFNKVNDSFYYPSKAKYEHLVDGVARRSFLFNLKSISANKPIDVKDMAVVLPPGTRVSDERFGVVYRSGAAPEDLVKEIGRYLSN
jgi:hypothetical protein